MVLIAGVCHSSPYVVIVDFCHLHQGDVTDEELVRALAGLGLGGEGLGGDDSMMGAMQGMMKSLISKEVLYPALKEMSNKVNYKLKFYMQVSSNL